MFSWRALHQEEQETRLVWSVNYSTKHQALVSVSFFTIICMVPRLDHLTSMSIQAELNTLFGLLVETKIQNG